MLVSVVAVSVITPAELASAANPNLALTQGPLALVAEKAIAPGAGVLLSIIALFATSSTILGMFVMASVFVYGMSKDGWLPKMFSEASKRHTPRNAILLILSVSLLFVLMGDLEIMGALTTMGTFLVFALANISLIKIRLDESNSNSHLVEQHGLFVKSLYHRGVVPMHRKNQQKIVFSPLNFKNIPLLAVFGATFCLAMFLTQFWIPIMVLGVKVPLMIVGLGFFATGLIVYTYFDKKK